MQLNSYFFFRKEIFFFMKRISIFLFLLSIKTNSNCQLKISDFSSFNIGKDLIKNKISINKFFSAKPIFSEMNDHPGSFDVCLYNQQFNYCKNADYTFLYVFDTLTNIFVDLQYEYKIEKDGIYPIDKINGTTLYIQCIEKLFNDIENSGERIFLLKEYSTLKLREIKKALDNPDSLYLVNKKNRYSYVKTNFYNYSGTDRLIIIATDIHFQNETLLTMYLSVEYTNVKYQDYRFTYHTGFKTLINESKSITLNYNNGVYSLPVTINNILTLDFVLDLGASDVTIGQDVFLTLVRSGTINEKDYLGETTYQLADGTIKSSKNYNLRSLKIGEVELSDIKVAVSTSNHTPLLLGQSALKKIQKFKIDNKNHKLLIE